MPYATISYRYYWNFWEILLYDWLCLLIEELHTVWQNLYFAFCCKPHLVSSLSLSLFFPMMVLDHYHSVFTETGPCCINWLSAHIAINGNSSNITKYAYLYGFFFFLSPLSLPLIMTVPPVAFHGVYTGILFICW